MGCGRGAVLLATAKRLPNGKAVGVDLWRADQTDNSPAATERNAEIEGVADRIELHTADMTALPFEDNTFDVIVSSWPSTTSLATTAGVMRSTKRSASSNPAVASPSPTSGKPNSMPTICERAAGSRSNAEASDGGCGTAARGFRRTLSPRRSRDESSGNFRLTLCLTGHLVVKRRPSGRLL